MPPYCKPITIMAMELLVAGAILFGGEGQTEPSQFYLQDDIRYFPPGPQPKATPVEQSAGLGDLVFSDVVSVHFVGPGHPANPDGSLGGLTAGDKGTQIRIYERYIVRESTLADGTTLRTLQAYEKIGRIEQRIPPQNARAK